MLRCLFFSLGLFVTLWGVSLLFVDQLVLNAKPDDQPQPEEGFRAMIGLRNDPSQPHKILDPPEWAAFSLLSFGSVTTLYSLALPKRMSKPGKA